MIQTIDYNKTSIRYSAKGEGVPLVFLHGYLLSLDVWLDFTSELSHDYRVICIDMPGHGESGLPSEISSMELMADVVKKVLDHLRIDSAVIFGHSMGGYAALALLGAHPEVFKAIVLFHSHTLADSEEVKKKRDREIKIIEKGQRKLLVVQSIPNMFASDTLSVFDNELKLCQNLAKKMDDQAVIAAIRGLRSRPERSELLRNAAVPCLNIIGRKDNFIDFEKVAMATELPLGSDRLILENAGHMGFYEDSENALAGIRQFLNRIL
ncbi:MAG: alpha/beta hydrolase [Bacteroidetes bacterium]|jgi:pimeloyl-ACP methyl ester carboxylesterase|nr:alpha/beta hydrolase [Bacteroidota bacterium]MBT3750379.1 alpha/beta hydrolase [Bacteroidota bacterium]MBT4397852.1 alpha/beta hydrolase [Bacteroidota bacterium]MBT4409700.1 alpha/beta hydrolase [Bacteroidota bacterium]MBT7091913.1 alpha/beta hydrolase [Bacteroidota bacterium]